MTARDYLRQLWRLAEQIRILQADIETDFARLTGTSVQLSADRVQTSPSGDKFADMMAALADKELQRDWLLLDFRLQRQVIVNQIAGMANPNYARLLFEHYANQKPLIIVAEEMHFSYSYLRRMHGAALAEFARQYPELKEDTQRYTHTCYNDSVKT